MLTIRSFILDGLALLGIVVGVAAGVDGYLKGLPDLPERTASAREGWSEPETTGSIAPKGEDPAVDGRGRHFRVTRPVEAALELPRGWVDPFYRRRDR